MEFFRKIDILYSTDFKFSVFNKTSFQTPLGGLLTILTLVITVFVTFYFGKDLYFRINPKIELNQTLPPSYRRLTLTRDNFLLYYQIQDGKGNTLAIEPNLYFKIYYFKSIGKNDGGIPIMGNPINIKSVTCDLMLVKNETYFKQKKMAQYNCLNLTNPDPKVSGFEVGGYWDEDFVDYFSMELSFCKNSTDDFKGINCTDLNNLTNFLYQNRLGTTINLYIQSGYLQIDQLENALQTQYSVYFQELNLNVRKKEIYIFQEMKLIDDKGILLPWYENSTTFSLLKQSLSYEGVVRGNVTEDYSNSLLYEAEFYFTRSTAEYRRNFMKLQDLTAQIGGFINGVFLSFKFFMAFFSDTEIKKIIINNIFDVSTDTSDSSSPNKVNLVELDKFIKRYKTQKLNFPNLQKNIANNHKSLFSEFNKNNNKSLFSEFNKNKNKSLASEFNKNNKNSLAIDDLNNKLESKNINLENNPQNKTQNKLVDFNINDEIISKNKHWESEMHIEQSIQKMDKKSTSYYKEKFREEGNMEKQIIFDIPYFTLIKKVICESCLNDENNQTLAKLSYAQIYIDEKLDLAYYLQLLIKFKYLLKMLLTKEERLLFNFTKKPPLKQIITDKVGKLLDKENKKELVNLYKIKNNVKGPKKKKSITDLLSQDVVDYLSKKPTNINENFNNDKI